MYSKIIIHCEFQTPAPFGQIVYNSNGVPIQSSTSAVVVPSGIVEQNQAVSATGSGSIPLGLSCNWM